MTLHHRRDDNRRARKRALRLLQGQINQSGHGLLPQPALPDLGAHGPPRMGAPSPKPPVPGEDSQRPQTPRGVFPRQRDDYDEQTAFDSYMNPEAGFHNGPGFQGP